MHIAPLEYIFIYMGNMDIFKISLFKFIVPFEKCSGGTGQTRPSGLEELISADSVVSLTLFKVKIAFHLQELETPDPTFLDWAHFPPRAYKMLQS